MNALPDCAERIYNKLGLFKLERLPMIIDCYYHIFFYHLRCLYNNISKQTCQILSYLLDLTIYLPVFVSFVELLEVFLSVFICQLGAYCLILAFLF